MPTLPHDRSHLLWNGEEGGGPTRLFTDSIDRWMDAMVQDECGGGGGSEEEVQAVVNSRNPGMLAGQFVANRLISRHFSNCEIVWHVCEGGAIGTGDAILSVSGPASSVLRCERVLLNVLGRMSGIATCTSEWVSSSGEMGVACTRKTSWGLLDKWAVHVGGGLTHRLSRADSLMIKENDLHVWVQEGFDETRAVSSAVNGIDLEANANFSVVEVSSVEQAIAAAEAWKNMQIKRGGSERIVLLLDNMGVSGSAMANQSLIEQGLRGWCILEGSGGVIRSELEIWAADAGVDLVSTSAMNRGVPPLNLSMRVVGD